MEPNTNGTTTAPAAEKPTIEQLKASGIAAWQEVIKHPDPFTDEAKAASMAYSKIQGEIKSAELAQAKVAAEAEMTEKRNARLALTKTLLDAHKALLAAVNDKKADPAKIAELQTAFDTAQEVVNNELLAKFAASRPAKVTSDKTSSNGTDGSDNSAAIVELHIAGKSQKEIEEMGYKRSTVWHAINKYKKANVVAS